MGKFFSQRRGESLELLSISLTEMWSSGCGGGKILLTKEGRIISVAINIDDRI